MPEQVFDLEQLTQQDVDAIGRTLQSIGARGHHRQAVAERIVRTLYDSLRIAATNKPACVLVRCFQTCPYARLPLEYQYAADALLEVTASRPNMRCLALLATRGSKRVWNDVATSTHHQCIPLPSVEVVQRAPMVARLMEQFGVSLERVVAAPEAQDLMLDFTQESFNVFHVEQALGSPFIPAQENFVKPYGVQSVLGAGGLLSDGELFAMVLFTRVPISHEVAEFFRTLALHVKLALLPFNAEKIFQKLHSD